MKVPPAKRVKLAGRHAEPVDLLTTLTKPGEYTLYVTASIRWTGSGVREDPSEQPIEIKRFRIPDSIFAKREAPRCCRVRAGLFSWRWTDDFEAYFCF